jgi:hypothetical protein
MKTQIITCQAANLRTTIATLKSRGYTHVTNAILPNWIAGVNYIEVCDDLACFALCSEEKYRKQLTNK